MTWTSQGLLSRIDWYSYPICDRFHVEPSFLVDAPPVVHKLIHGLRDYFETGEPMGEIPWDLIDTRQWSEFQHIVYRAIARIPHGETRTYAWVARQASYTRFISPRAVGQALKKNMIPIFIPCHRVVSATSIGGFMGMNDPNLPELQFKQRLIELEQLYRNPVFPFLSMGSSPDLALAGAFA